MVRGGEETGSRISRRRWLGRAVAAGLVSVRAIGSRPAMAEDVGEGEASALARAKEAGLANVGVSRTEHYVAVGDALEAFREDGLALCERLAATFQKHFQAKGFDTTLPARRMTVVALAGPVSYAKFKGAPAGEAEGGHYDLDADRLVIFDSRGAGPNAERVNSFTLVHEAIHQLGFDSGLLARKADVPLAVSEGLATYGELWRKGRPDDIGQVNGFRVTELGKAGQGWIEVERLLTTDALFDDQAAQQLAYAEAWALVYHLMKTRAGAAKFRSYLALVNTRLKPGRRAEDATKALGDLTRLDRELKKAAVKLVRG